MFTVGAHIPLRDPRLPASLRGGAVAAGVVLAARPARRPGRRVVRRHRGRGALRRHPRLGLGGRGPVDDQRGAPDRPAGADGDRPGHDRRRRHDPRDPAGAPARPASHTRRSGARSSPPAPPRCTSSPTGSTGKAGRIACASARSGAGGRWICACPCSSCSRCRGSPQESGTSVLVAGFATGLLVAAFGGPKRLFTQVRGLADGFFVPLFFVVLGARLELGALIDHPSILRLTVALVVLNVAVHLVAAGLTSPAHAGRARRDRAARRPGRRRHARAPREGPQRRAGRGDHHRRARQPRHRDARDGAPRPRGPRDRRRRRRAPSPGPMRPSRRP